MTGFFGREQVVRHTQKGDAADLTDHLFTSAPNQNASTGDAAIY
jgi:hypothetical protein